MDDLARTPLIPTTDHTKAIVITQGTDSNNNATLLARTIDLTNGQLIGTGVLLRDLVTPTGVTYSSDAGHAYLIGSTPGVVGETQLTVVDMATGELIGTPITTDGLAGRGDGGPGTALEFGQGGTKALLFTRYLRSSDNMYSSVVTTVDLAQSQIIGTFGITARQAQAALGLGFETMAFMAWQLFLYFMRYFKRAKWGRDTKLCAGNALTGRLLLSLRGFADVVLVGAGTVRAEGYGPVRLTADQIAERRRR